MAPPTHMTIIMIDLIELHNTCKMFHVEQYTHGYIHMYSVHVYVIWNYWNIMFGFEYRRTCTSIVLRYSTCIL